MKSTIEFKKNLETYPCLKIYKDDTFIVLFTNPKTGTVVYSINDEWEVGGYSDDWVSNNAFRPLYNVVIQLES